jgi:hypothetical protein
MKILIEERDETQKYRIVPIQQLIEMVRVSKDKTVIRVPNCCGGETKITVFNSTIPDGNPDTIEALRK